MDLLTVKPFTALFSRLPIKNMYTEIFLIIISYKVIFLTFFRFIGGVADAAALGAVISILMKLYPKYVTSIVSWTEMLFGLGYMLGRIMILFFRKVN